ncbi:hypothetical protein ACFYO2_34985 [Streptomyces sp. NPDC006602]|uniref:hypothetical protein n=1 Tax=Streptomyces sp. NPDC006602 TaxID=3364751 RepID=UPI003677CFC2
MGDRNMPPSTGESEPIGSIGGYMQQGTRIENLSAPVMSTTYDRLCFANRYGRLLALDRETGAVRWTTDQLDERGTSAQDRIPSVLLVKDAIVAVAGDTAFSVRPDRAGTS